MEEDNWSLGFTDKEGDDFAINFDPDENNIYERKYTELGFSIFGTITQVCDFHWIGDKKTYNTTNTINKPINPRQTLRIYDETEDTVYIASITPENEDTPKNPLPSGIIARLDDKERPFYVDTAEDVAYKVYLDSTERIECEEEEVLQNAGWVEDTIKYGIIRENDLSPQTKYKFKRVKKPIKKVTNDDLFPSLLAYEKHDINSYSIVEFQGEKPVFNTREIVRMASERYIIHECETWYRFSPHKMIYEEKMEEDILTEMSSTLKRIPDAPHPFTRRYGGDMMYAIRINATLFELKQSLIREKPSIADILHTEYVGNIIPFANCMYNVDTNTILPYTPYLFTKTCYDAIYDPRIQEHPVEKIYRGIIPDEDTLKFFFEYVGYILFHSDMTAPSLLLMYGRTGTGKSALAETIRTAIGTRNVSFLSLDQLSSQFEVSELLGKRLNIASETGDTSSSRPFGQRPDGELLKRLADGTEVTFPIKYKQPIVARNTAKMIFLSNTPPDFGDSSSAIYRRLHVIPCRQTQIWEDMIYDDLQERDAISWLINKSLKGYRGFVNRGYKFTESEEMEAELVAHKRQNNLYDFLATYFGVNSVNDIRLQLNGEYLNDLYIAYTEHTKEGGGHPLSKRRMSEQIRNEYDMTSENINTTRGGRRTMLSQFVIK